MEKTGSTMERDSVMPKELKDIDELKNRDRDRDWKNNIPRHVRIKKLSAKTQNNILLVDLRVDVSEQASSMMLLVKVCSRHLTGCTYAVTATSLIMVH